MNTTNYEYLKVLIFGVFLMPVINSIGSIIGFLSTSLGLHYYYRIWISVGFQGIVFISVLILLIKIINNQTIPLKNILEKYSLPIAISYGGLYLFGKLTSYLTLKYLEKEFEQGESSIDQLNLFQKEFYLLLLDSITTFMVYFCLIFVVVKSKGNK